MEPIDSASQMDCKTRYTWLWQGSDYHNKIKWFQMKTMLRYTSIFSVIVWIALITESQSTILNRNFRQVQNRRITNSILDNYLFISLFRCASICLSHLDCIEINYGQDECELLSTGSNGNIASEGWVILCKFMFFYLYFYGQRAEYVIFITLFLSVFYKEYKELLHIIFV